MTTGIRPVGTLVLALLAAALLIPASRAFAHAGYDHSTPAMDEVVATAPAQVDAFFKQTIFRQTGSFYLRVYADDNSTEVSQGDGTLDDNDRKHMFATLPSGLTNGRYIVHWKTLSDDDGDSAEGMYCFYVGVQPTAAQQAECASFAPTPVPTVQASPAATVAPTPTAASDGGGGGGSNAGVIIGVIVGVVAVVVIGGGAAVWWRSRRT